MKKVIFLIAIFFALPTSILAQDQFTIDSQKDRLLQYAGHWVSSVNVNTDSVLEFPDIKMTCKKDVYDNSLSVTVYQKEDNEYFPILKELMGFDAISNQIIASGHNNKGEFFIGKGLFSSENKWEMQDEDLLGSQTMKVNFDFNSYTDVSLKGTNGKNETLWETRYIKNNPKDKNIGVQLVSVHKQMLKDLPKTLKNLSRMGYSYVETFVYSDGGFYGLTPLEFRTEVERYGMKFLGSMTFFDAFDKTDKDVSNWWHKTIKDHKIAGVEYLSTSNNNIKNIKTLKELKQYCDYYNKVGKWCKENGLKFIFHNHKDEFLFIEGVRAYDYLLENTNPEYVHFQADLYWMNVAGVNPIDYFKRYPNRFISWHVKDYKELGKSYKIDFKNIFKYAEVAGLKYTVAEVEDYNFPPLFSVGLAWDYIYYELLK